MAEHEELVLAVGPYLLGALDPETRREVRDHLDVCETCRQELIRLAAVPGFLSQAAPRKVDPDLEPPAALRERLVAQVVAERAASRRRMQLATAAALLLLFLPVGVFTALRIGRSGAAPQQPLVTETDLDYVAMAPTDAAGTLRGEVGWRRRDWGVELALETWGGTPGERLTVVAEARDGRREQAAAWQSTGGRVPATGTTSIVEQDMARVLVTSEAGAELLVLDVAAP